MKEVEEMASSRKRAPLADLTNRLPSSPDFGTSTGSNSAGATASSSSAAAAEKSFLVTEAVAFVGGEKSKRSIIKCRQDMLQRKKYKRKRIMHPAPMSCPPAGRTRSAKSKRVTDLGSLKSHSESHPASTEPKRKRRHSMPVSVESYKLPQDFIEKQRAYFAEIDAFELDEEEVSASESE